MTREGATLTGRAAELRRAFDQSFAEPRRQIVDDVEALLGLRQGDEAYAVRLNEVAGLFVDRKIVPVPSPMPGLLGLAGLRAGLVPVYSLGALLERPSGQVPPRWLLLAGSSEPIGLAFDQFDGHLHVPRSGLLPSQSAPRPHVVEAARGADAIRGVVSIRSIVKAIKERTGVFATMKEQ